MRLTFRCTEYTLRLEATDVINKFIYMAIIKIVYIIIVLLTPIVLIHAFHARGGDVMAR